MADFFEEIMKIKAIAGSEIKADIDGMIAEIDLVKQNFEGAQTEQQIQQAIENQRYYTNRAKKYKKTKTYADTINNVGENKLNDYNTYEFALKSAFEYMEKNKFLDTPSEWTSEHMNKMIEGIRNDDGSQTYESLVHYFIKEQEKVGTWLSDLATLGKDGKTPTRKQFRYDKNMDKDGISVKDANVIGRINKYAEQLGMGIQMLYRDGIITPEEAYLLFTGDSAMYNTKKTENKKIAKDIINNNFKRQDGILTLMQRVDAGAVGLDINALLNQQDPTGQLASQTNILESDTAETIKQKLQRVMDGSNTQLGMGYSKWLAWEGSPYVGSAANLPSPSDLDKGIYTKEQLDAYTREELDLAQKFIDDETVPDETVNMEAYKSRYESTYGKGYVPVKIDDSKKELVSDDTAKIEITGADKFAAEEGFLDSQIADIIKGGGALYAYSKRHKAIKAVADQTTKVYEWFANNTKLSGNQIATILESDIVSRDLKNMRPTLDNIKKIEEQMKTWREANPSVTKDALKYNEKYKKLIDKLKGQENKLSQLNNKLSSTIKKYLKVDISVDDMKKILNNPDGLTGLDKWRKKLMNDYPKLAKKWFTTDNIGKLGKTIRGTLTTVGGVAKGAVAFAGAQTVGHKVEEGIEGAISAIVGHDVTMEDITGIKADSLLDSVAETAVGYKTVQTSSKWLVPKLIQMAKSPVGKTILTKLLGEAVVKRFAAAKITPHPIAKLVLYGVGIIALGVDVRNYVMNFHPGMTDEEGEDMIKQIEYAQSGKGYKDFRGNVRRRQTREPIRGR